MKTALFMVPNPMFPKSRMMSFETRRQVKDVAEAEAIALRMGWEFNGFDK